MHFVLDTGMTQSYIARGLAAEAGLREGRVGPIMIYAFGGERTVQGAVHDDATTQYSTSAARVSFSGRFSPCRR
jgi:hypothetical protein